MIRYKLADLIKKIKKFLNDEVVLPPIEESAKAKIAYLGVLRSMLRELARAARIARDEYTLKNLNDLADRLGSSSESMARRILRLEAERHTSTFIASAKRSLGVDLSAVVRDEDLGEYLARAGLRNAALIKGLASDTVKRVQNTVTTAQINGTSQTELAKALTEQFGLSDRRAKVIARDQVGKLNSDLNRIRQEQAGITHYRWQTADDERVRPLHRSLDGSVYEYGKPTGAENGLPPGQPIMCRCVAIGIVKF